MLESLFKKPAGWRPATLFKKYSSTDVFLWSLQNFCKIFKKTFLYRTPPVAAFVFFLKSNSTDISQPCYDVLLIFSPRHLVWCIKSWTRLFINSSSIAKFSKQLRQGVPYKAENWHAWSHGQYFSKHRFLAICQCAFKDFFSKSEQTRR